MVVPNGRKEYTPKFTGEFKGSGTNGNRETWTVDAKFKLNFNFQITGIDFQNNYDINDKFGDPLVSSSDYEWTPTKQEPVVYKMNSTPKIKVCVKCVDAPLDGLQKIKLYCTGANPLSLSFGNVDTPITLNFSGGIATTVMTAQSQVTNEIRKGIYVMNWNGDIEPTTINQIIYTTYDAPKCEQKLFRKDTIDKTISWASGTNQCNTSNSPTNIVRAVQKGIKDEVPILGYKSQGMQTDPWVFIPANKGDCLTYADWMTKSMQLLGITATTREIKISDNQTFFSQKSQPYWLTDEGDIDADGIKNKNTQGYTPGIAGNRGTIKGEYIDAADRYIWKPGGPTDIGQFVGVKSDADKKWFDDNQPWNVHGACECVGHWWEITFNSTPDHDTPSNMKKIGGPVIKVKGPKNETQF